MSDKTMKNIPKLRFPEFLNELEWKEKKIKNIFSIFQGYAFSSNDSVTDGVRWLKIADVDIQQMNSSTPSFLPHEFVNKYNKFLVKKGDYVIALTRPILNNKLKIAKIDDNYDGALLNQRVGKILTKENSHFVYFLLQKSDLINEIENSISGSEPPNLSAQQIENIIVHIPLIDEQQKIADCLSSLDSLIIAQSQKVEFLKEHKKGLLQNLFPKDGESVPKYRFSEFINDGDWEEKPLRKVCIITNGKSNAQDHDENGIYPLFDRSEVIKKSNNFLFDCEAVIIPGEGVRFVPKYYKGKFDLHQRAYALQNFKENGKFVYHFMDFTKDILASQAVLSTVLSLRLPILENFTIKLPKPKEQQKIADCLTSIDNEINLQIQKVESLKEHKKALLQQLFPKSI